MRVWLRCAARFQSVSSWTQNILSGLSLPHISIIKMRRGHTGRWQKAQEWNQGPVRAVTCSTGQRALTPILSTAGEERGKWRQQRDRWWLVERARQINRRKRNKRMIVKDMCINSRRGDMGTEGEDSCKSSIIFAKMWWKHGVLHTHLHTVWTVMNECNYKQQKIVDHNANFPKSFIKISPTCPDEIW